MYTKNPYIPSISPEFSMNQEYLSKKLNLVQLCDRAHLKVPGGFLLLFGGFASTQINPLQCCFCIQQQNKVQRTTHSLISMLFSQLFSKYVPETHFYSLIFFIQWSFLSFISSKTSLSIIILFFLLIFFKTVLFFPDGKAYASHD